MNQVESLFTNHWISIDRAKRGPANHKEFLTKEGSRIMRERRSDFELIQLFKKSDSYIFTAENSNKPLAREAFTNLINKFIKDCSVKRAELVNKTPFDDYESSLALQVIDDRLKSIYGLIINNPELTRQYVEETILPIQDMLESLDEKINILLPKRKKERTILPLRDPVNTELFEIFIAAAGSTAKYKKDLKCAQLRIAYTILFHTGLRVNEMRLFKEKDIQDAIKTSQFSVVHYKQRAPHIHVISDSAVEKLKKLKHYYEIVFVKYKYQYLFGKKEPVAEKHLIRTINNDLKHTCKINQIPYNIKSHSFRINMISKLLQNTSVQNAADIIGHRDIQSTMAYKRYAMNKKEIKTLLNRINKNID